MFYENTNLLLCYAFLVCSKPGFKDAIILFQLFLESRVRVHTGTDLLHILLSNRDIHRILLHYVRNNLTKFLGLRDVETLIDKTL